MKEDDKPDYWTRVFRATSKGSKESWKYLSEKYSTSGEKKKNWEQQWNNINVCLQIIYIKYNDELRTLSSWSQYCQLIKWWNNQFNAFLNLKYSKFVRNFAFLIHLPSHGDIHLREHTLI